ncbi:hypothetical protein Hanom_Chr12g01116491 [Helianthus anomalus]
MNLLLKVINLNSSRCKKSIYIVYDFLSRCKPYLHRRNVLELMTSATIYISVNQTCMLNKCWLVNFYLIFFTDVLVSC